MTGGTRYVAAPGKGRRRLGLVGFGVLAALTLVWQQQATLASSIDSEHAKAAFTAATLSAIEPKVSANIASIDVTWDAAKRSWTTPQYRLYGSATGTGTGTTLFSGPATGYNQGTGTATAGQQSLNFTAVAAGTGHACGISEGTVYCWGTSLGGGLGLGSQTVARVPTAVTGGELNGRTVTAVTAGADFTCAVAAGKAYCWGKGGNGQLGNGGQSSQTTPTAVSILTGITTISAGTSHVCALAAGKPYCWGQGSNGQLGDSGTNQKELPTAVKTDGVLTGRTLGAISAGGNHSCVLADGQAFCWGLNSSGELGDGGTTQRATPVAVDTTGALLGRTMTAIAAGGSHTCALAEGQAFCWGLGTSGQLGNSASASSTTPVAVTGSTSYLDVTSGPVNSCALSTATAYCWGSGVGTAPTSYGGVASGHDLLAVSIGPDFACAAAVSAPAACLGAGTGYQLGNNGTGTTTGFGDVTLTGAACPTGSVRIATGCSLVQGTDYYYRLGYSVGSWPAPDSAWVSATTGTRSKIVPTLGSRTSTSITTGWPVAEAVGQAYPEYQLERATSSAGAGSTTLAVTGDRSWTDLGGLAMTRKFTDVSAGAGHSCGIVSGDLYCWGLNDKGQLGVGDMTTRSIPTRVIGAMGTRAVTAVSVGGSHTCAIAGGNAYCWGSNGNGQVGDGTTGQQNSPVAVSSSGVLSGKTVTAVSAGTSHSCVVASSRAYCWGYNANGQLGDASGTSRTVPVAVSTTNGDLTTKAVTDIAAGGAHSCAVAESRAYCWGLNGNGQLGGNSLFGFINLSSTSPVAVTATGVLNGKLVTQVSAGDSHSCVVASKRAYCWGKGGSGQLGNGNSFGDSVNPVAVTTSGVMSADVALVSAGGAHSCAVAGGKGFCWGSDSSGQLGNGSGTSSSSPIAITTNGALASATVTSITAGGTHGCAVGDSSAYCWGNGADGRLGNRATASTTLPVMVAADARCAAGSSPLGNGTCSLAAGTTYWYRVTFTLDGTTITRGNWTPLATS